MPKKIAIVGTLDTKGEQIKYLKDRIEGRGNETIVIDVGVLGRALFEPDITREQVAQASGSSLEEISTFNDEARAIGKMAIGASEISKKLCSSGNLDGLLGLGGTMGTSLALTVMRTVPFHLPKLIVSTCAFAPFITPEAVSGDLMMMEWPAGLWGLNRMSERTLDMAAGAISGAAETYRGTEVNGKKIVGITTLGPSVCTYLNLLKTDLEKKGYEVAAFHTQGIGGRIFEQAIGQGLIGVALDLGTCELVNQTAGGAYIAGEERLETAGEKGIPQIVAPGCLDIFGWVTGKPFPRRLRTRPKHEHNSLVTAVKSSKEEKVKAGKLIAEKLNKAKGPTAMVIPMQGFSAWDKPGGFSYDPEGREAFRKMLRKNLKPEIKVIELDAHINDSTFCDEVMRLFDQMVDSSNLIDKRL
jgi:uncharacterized protein (UPF0261 family)